MTETKSGMINQQGVKRDRDKVVRFMLAEAEMARAESV